MADNCNYKNAQSKWALKRLSCKRNSKKKLVKRKQILFLGTKAKLSMKL